MSQIAGLFGAETKNMENTSRLFYRDDDQEEEDSVSQFFDRFDDDWEEANPKKALLLSYTVGKDSREIKKSSVATVSEKLLAEVNLSVFPFHHLICADLLIPWNNDLRVRYLSEMREPNISDERIRGLYWQALASNGVSAKEAALLDDIDCTFFEEINGESVRFDWEVVYYDHLQGCAENYLREMFCCKQRIFEAGDDLRTVLEIVETELVSAIPAEIAQYVGISDPEKLLTGSFLLSFTLSAKYKIYGSSESDKGSTNIALQRIRISRRRVETYLFKKEKTENKGQGIYRFKLSDYWLDWQRTARLSGFDFNFIKHVPDAKIVRFYEITKLCRVTEKMKTGDELPKKLTIEYEKFIALMPLPKYSSEREIERQIKELTALLKTSGYVRSFSIRSGLSRRNNGQITLVFNFND
jgi:hypothetical protein